tara:strand:- start:646 stop:897 length:252 start_codon:yes stop_codon:yes gene_type:complete
MFIIKKMIKRTLKMVPFFAAVSVGATDLSVGDMAPDFRLQATTGKFYQIRDFRNIQPVVLAWYPRANTSSCTIECKSLVERVI